MEDTKFKIGVYLLAVGTLLLIARFVMPNFVGHEDDMTWEILIILSMVVYLISAVFLFLGRKKK